MTGAELRYLLCYRSDLNPIEQLFAKLQGGAARRFGEGQTNGRKNARLTPNGREAIVLAVWMTGLARSAFNIRKPFAKVGRFEGGAFGIVKSRPHSRARSRSSSKLVDE